MKVLCIGHASYDISMPLEEYPIENIKYRVNEKIECGGGPASTAAYLLGSFGVPTVFKGVVGNDIFGRRIVSEFKEIGVDTRYIEVNNKVDTTISFIIINKKNGSRTVFNYASSYPMLRNNEYDFYPEFILIDGHNYRGSKLALEKFPNAISVIDAGRDAREVIELAGMVNYLVCSKEFAEKVSNIKIDFNGLKEKIAELKKENLNIATLFDNVKTKANQIPNFWLSQTSDVVINDLKNLYNKFEEIIASNEKYISYLETVCNNYINTDKDIETLINSNL